jgi:hypothetical protein
MDLSQLRIDAVSICRSATPIHPANLSISTSYLHTKSRTHPLYLCIVGPPVIHLRLRYLSIQLLLRALREGRRECIRPRFLGAGGVDGGGLCRV